MANEKRGDSDAVEPLSAHDKIARLLGILAVKDKTDSADKVVMLQGAGFGAAEISAMLDITRNAVDQINFRRRKNKKKSGKSSKKQ
jgi:inorganic pyrophosphatase